MRRIVAITMTFALCRCGIAGTVGGGAHDASDASGEDGGIAADGGGTGETDDVGCRARGEPPYPTSWPFRSDKATYKSVFWEGLPARATTCSLGGCHDLSGVRPPLIPAAETTLDDPANLATAIRELWDRSIPIARPDASVRVSELEWHHRLDGGPEAMPFYRPEQSTFIRSYVEHAARCGWAPIVAREAVAGPRCDDAGLCDCPLPSGLDLSACAMPDAGQ